LLGEQFNGVLHPEYLRRLDGEAEAFAAEQGISKEEARNRLTRVLESIALTKAGTAASEFGTYAKNEGIVQEAFNLWPPTRGAYGPATVETLQPGYLIDRFGEVAGKFVSPLGVPFGNRALPNGNLTKPYSKYEVLKPINDVPTAKALPWFGQPGGGTQHELPKPIQWYLNNGYLKKCSCCLRQIHGCSSNK
jgi:filamentous hemagglutinin